MKSIIVFLASAVLSLLAAELLVRTFVPVREVGAVLSMQDRVVGKRLRPSINTERQSPEFVMRFSTNADGFRGPERRGFSKPILFLGDSFTMGYGVSDGYEFPAVVEARLREIFPDKDIETINAGIGNNGNGQWVKFLSQMLDELSPSVIVLQFSQNDFDDNVRERYFSLASPNGHLIENQIQISWPRRIESFLSGLPGVSQSHLYAAMRQVFVWRSAMADSRSRQPGAVGLQLEQQSEVLALPYRYKLAEALIAETVKIVRAADHPVIGILVGLQDFELELIRGVFGQLDVPVLIVPDKSERPDIYFAIDGHWNDSGHTYVAGEVVELLKSLGARSTD